MSGSEQMALVVSTPGSSSYQRHDGAGGQAASWPNRQSGISAIGTVSTILGLAAKLSRGFIAAANAPTRLVSMGCALQQRNIVKLSLDTASFLTLCFAPYGPFLSIAVDLGSEAVNFRQNRRQQQIDDFVLSPHNLPNPTIRENALRILDVSEELLKDPSALEAIYLRRLGILVKKRDCLPQPMADNIQSMILTVEQAYRTLVQDIGRCGGPTRQ